MSLRIKLLLAQLPLMASMVIVGVLALQTIGVLGLSAQTILKDNYRSVLAAERMESDLDRLLYRELSRCAQIALPDNSLQAEASFERELQVQEGNITEPGEAEATHVLRTSWDAYRKRVHDAESVPSGGASACLLRLQRLTDDVRIATGRILDINQDAMVHKSEHAHALAERRETMMLFALVAAFIIGVYASTNFTARLLRPLGVLSLAARRLGSGDFQARAQIHGRDEIAGVAHEFNTMADHLAAYRSSSLGELLQAQQLTQAAIDGLPDPVLLLRPSGELLGSHGKAESVLKLANRAPEGLIFDVLPAALRSAVEKAIAHVISGKGAYAPAGYEEAVQIEGADGASSFLPRANPVYDESGSIAGVAVILQDITRERRFDELRSDLVATIAHEFRTPLTSLRMSLYILREQTIGPDKQMEMLEAARQDTERLHGLVEELLELSRLEHGKTEMQRKPTTPAQLANDAIARNGRLGEESLVTVQNELSPFLPEVFVDPDRVPLVLDNLLSNAIRHSAKKGVVYLRAQPVGDSVRFTVSDSGPGISPEHRERIFEKFYRVPGRGGGSAGLGLYIAREVVRNHGGEIGVESQSGKGSSFWFTLPVVPQLKLG
jgi:signal transduction histidine kinase